MGILSSGGNDNGVTVSVHQVSDGTGIKDTQNDLQDLDKQGSETKDNLQDFTDGFSDGLDKVAKFSAVAGAGLTLFSKNSVDKLTELTKSSKALSTQTGLSVEDSSKLTAAFQRMGVSGDGAALSMRTLAKQIADARTDTTDTTNKLNELGIAVKNTDGTARDFDDILYSVADKFQTLPNGAEKTADAMALFGRQGASMIKVLSGGSDGLKDMEAQAEKLGLTLTSENIGTVNDYIKSQKELADTTQSLQLQVGQLTAPILTEFNVQLNNAAQAVIGTNSPIRDLTANVLAFGGPVLGAVGAVAEFGSNLQGAVGLIGEMRLAVMAPMIMPAIGVGAALAALGLVIEKTYETKAAVDSANDAINAAKAAGDATDASIKKQFEEGKISQEKYQTYLNNTRSVADQNAQAIQDRYQGVVGNVEHWLDNLFGLETNVGNGVAKGNKSGKGWATGGFTGIGGMDDVAGYVHSGEYVLRQDQVDQSTGQPKAGVLGGGGSVTHNQYDIGQVVLSTGDAVRSFFAINDTDMQYTSMGMSPSRGA